MTPLILTRRNGQAETLGLNAADISRLQGWNNLARVYTPQGPAADLRYADYQDATDIRAVAAQAIAAGATLTQVPMRAAHVDLPYAYDYINPRVVTFMTTSRVREDDGMQGVILEVTGGWRVETFLTPEELAQLTAIVLAAKPDMLHFSPAEASARWLRAESLYIDAAAITELRTDFMDVYVKFGNSKPLDLNLAPGVPKDQVLSGVHVLAQKLLAANGHKLTELENAQYFCALRPEDIDFAIAEARQKHPTHGYALCIKPRDQGQVLHDHFHVFFKTEEDQMAALKLIKPEVVPFAAKKAKPPHP